jgi:hypothetical protein
VIIGKIDINPSVALILKKAIKAVKKFTEGKRNQHN